jgi:hypothetical protein
MSDPGTVYLLCFEEEYVSQRTTYTDESGSVRNGKRRKRARHYVGWTLDLEARLQEHRGGRGSRLMAAVAGAGIEFVVSVSWRGNPKLEQWIKARKQHATFCPRCSPSPRVPISDSSFLIPPRLDDLPF